MQWNLLVKMKFSISVFSHYQVKLATGLSSLFGNKERLLMIKMRNPWGKKEWNGAWSDR